MLTIQTPMLFPKFNVLISITYTNLMTLDFSLGYKGFAFSDTLNTYPFLYNLTVLI